MTCIIFKGEEELIVIHIYGVLIMLYFCLNVVMYLILNPVK